MANKVIGDYTAATTIDGSTHYLLIQPGNSSTAYNKINRNTLLSITGAPVGTTDSQSISNKTVGNSNTVTLKDTLFTLQDDGDITKQAQFQLSGITTGTTRTYTLPNVSDTLVALTASQTLTNKTLTAPVITNGSITGTTITTDAIVGQSVSTNGTVYGLSITGGKISGTSISNATVGTTQIAANAVSAILLKVTESTDFVSGLPLTANTWTDFKANQTFTVTTAGSIVAITISAGVQAGGTNVASIASRLVIDSAGTPQNIQYGMNVNDVAGSFINPFNGGTVYITGLSVGAHTVKTQILSTTANSAFCRTSTVSNTEFYTTTVVEIKR